MLVVQLVLVVAVVVEAEISGSDKEALARDRALNLEPLLEAYFLLDALFLSP